MSEDNPLWAWWRYHEHTLTLTLRLTPRGARSGVVEASALRLRIKVNAAPVAGAANKALCKLLAKEFAVPMSQVTLLGAAHSRTKRVQIHAPRRWPDWLPDECGGVIDRN